VLSLLLKPWIATCHEARDRLSDFLEDELDARTRRRIVRHLARCERCRAMRESLSRTLEQLRSLGTVEQVATAPATVSSVLERVQREDR
jgi:predicted anti-sigma-YlaC factor YlaD